MPTSYGLSLPIREVIAFPKTTSGKDLMVEVRTHKQQNNYTGREGMKEGGGKEEGKTDDGGHGVCLTTCPFAVCLLCLSCPGSLFRSQLCAPAISHPSTGVGEIIQLLELL
jgi:hypothetical protein